VVDEAYFFVIDQSKGTFRARRIPRTPAGSVTLILDELSAYPGVPHRNEVAQAMAARLSFRADQSKPIEGFEVFGESEDPPPLCDEIEECEHECSGSWTASLDSHGGLSA
jgi:hypothetical protein